MSSAKSPEACTLWGLPHSLYAGKARCYLIKKGIPFRELGPSHPGFQARILPKVGHMVLPVVELADGAVLQDTSDIIESMEAKYPEPAITPSSPVLAVVAWLIGAFGSEGLLPAAMHYRWSYREQQENFLRAEFGRALEPGPDREKRQAAGEKLMDYFGGMLPGLGVTEDSAGLIEDNYLELLDALDIHLQHFPYMLGGRPSIADVGLMAPLYAHLGRDPVPASLMKNLGPNVYRWTERMNSPVNLDGEFAEFDEVFFPEGTLFPTLEPVLALIFRDWAPELIANLQCYERWLEANPDMPAGTLVSASGESKVHPTLGMVEFQLGDQSIKKASVPQALWHFSKVWAMAANLSGEASLNFESLMKRTGGEQLMSMKLPRAIERRDYALVLA